MVSQAFFDSIRPPQIVCLKRGMQTFGPSCDLQNDVVYCGRALRRKNSWQLTTSKWANPFFDRSLEETEENVQKFSSWFHSSRSAATTLWDQIWTLSNKRLACWCAIDSSCHCQTLVQAWRLWYSTWCVEFKKVMTAIQQKQLDGGSDLFLRDVVISEPSAQLLRDLGYRLVGHSIQDPQCFGSFQDFIQQEPMYAVKIELPKK
jgi:hypothetical protein